MRWFVKAIKEDVRAYLRLDPATSNVLQLIFFNASFQGLLLYRISHLFYRWKLHPLAYLFHYLCRVLFSMDIHPAAEIEPGVVIDHGIGVVIGATATVKSGTVIYHGVTLGAKHICSGKRHPDVGRNVIIGAGAKILGPIKVGDNSVIGANAVVLNDVPENCLAVGIPARIVRRDENVEVGGQHTDGEIENRTKGVREAREEQPVGKC
ncbi:serine O-acetyltransferase [Thermotoga sp. Ku-13t]|uniref:serine O-acetyltransferase n=1 Tax=Thermotoga sp. Ku-13t TaxID=1755813 RepID=UPI001F49D249|nr:serine O-acetyltransferase [Thermotoga sp. Ku-13t]